VTLLTQKKQKIQASRNNNNFNITLNIKW